MIIANPDIWSSVDCHLHISYVGCEGLWVPQMSIELGDFHGSFDGHDGHVQAVGMWHGYLKKQKHTTLCIPYAPCMVYLPTFAQKNTQMYKYTIHGAYGYV